MDVVSLATNALHSLDAENHLLQLLIAMLVPVTARAIYHFFHRTYPNGLHWFLTRYILHREVAAVQCDTAAMFQEGFNRLIDDNALVEIILDYIGYVSKLDRKESGKKGDNAAGAAAAGSDHLPYAPSVEAMRDAGLRYAARSTFTTSDAAAYSGPRGLQRLLQEEFSLSIIPSKNVALEVEPGLFVRHIPTTHNVVSQKVADEDEEVETLQEGLKGSADKYLLYDLFDQLGPRAKRRQIRRPFDADSEEEEEQSDDDDSEAFSETSEVDKVPRQVSIYCRDIIGAQERTEFVRRFSNRVKLGLEPPLPVGTPVEDCLLPRNRIDAFLSRARRWYESQAAARGHQLYLYIPSASEAAAALGHAKKQDDGEGDIEVGEVTEYNVHRYPFPSTLYAKTFSSLFFSQKDRVLQLLDDFTQKSGKFAVAGAAHSMTWLLHGPPGTGKTSLVKAMARYLNRHVVVLQLNKIKTNTMLFHWTNEMRVRVQAGYEGLEESGDSDEDSEEYYYDEDDHEPISVRLLPRDVIYLLEDIDAVDVAGITAAGCDKDDNEDGDENGATGTNRTTNSSSTSDKQSDASSSTSSSASSSDDATCSSTCSDESESADDDDDDESSSSSVASSDDASSQSAAKGSGSDATTSSNDEDGGSDDDDEDEEDTAEAKRARMKALMDAILKTFSKDLLDVNGIIRALTSVANPDGRIVVMTTNHPERLDPRLLHPSVLSMKINMSNLTIDECIHMIRHYYPEEDFSDALAARVRTALAAQDGKSVRATTTVNPARLEQLCAECQDIQELVNTLESGRIGLVENVF